MTPLERLRVAAALSHAVPGAELRLVTDRGERIVVGHHPTADIDPCALRRVVAASACPSNPDFSRRIAEVSVCGALLDMGGGVLASVIDGVEQRWVASLLRPTRVAELLGDVGLEDVPDDAMHACVKPNGDLGISIVAVTANDGRFLHALDAVAARAAAVCFVDELWCAASQLVQRRDNAGGPGRTEW